MAKTRTMLEAKLAAQAQSNSENEVIIGRLQKQLSEKEGQVKALAEAKTENERGRAKMMEELRHNNDDILGVKQDYKAEIERLSGLLKSLTANNERLKGKLEESEIKLSKSADIIEDYKAVIEGVNKTKEDKMKELVDAEIENEKLKKAIDVHSHEFATRDRTRGTEEGCCLRRSWRSSKN